MTFYANLRFQLIERLFMKFYFLSFILLSQMTMAFTIECTDKNNNLVAYTSKNSRNETSFTFFSSRTNQKLRFDSVMLYDSDETEVNLIAQSKTGQEAMMYLFKNDTGMDYTGKLSVLLNKNTQESEDTDVSCSVQ